jgi:hypothetical protein
VDVLLTAQASYVTRDLVNREGEPAKIALGLLKLTVPLWVPPWKFAGSPLPFSHEAG